MYIKYNCNIMQPSLILLWEIESSKRPDQQEAVSDEEATETETEDEAEVSWLQSPLLRKDILNWPAKKVASRTPINNVSLM